MVINRENEGGEEHQAMDGGNPLSNPSSPRARTDENLVEEIIAIIESVKAIGEYRKTQRKECANLVRRLKLFLPLLEEIRDVERTKIPDAGILCLKKLKKAFQCAKKLLKLCHGGSKIYLVGNCLGFLQSCFTVSLSYFWNKQNIYFLFGKNFRHWKVRQ